MLSPSKRIVIAGGSGFLGKNLARFLQQKNYEVTILSRNPDNSDPTSHQIFWDGRTLDNWSRELDGAAAIVNLAGRSVDCIKTPDHCDEILRSRVEPTRALGKALRSVEDPPPVWIQMATAHRYGDPLETVCDEESAFGYGLAPFVAKAWEDAFEESKLPEMRGVVLRTSFVLEKTGGALARLAKLARCGLGGRVGHGKQGISWIHEIDLNRIFHRSLTDPSMNGPYLTTAPKPVSNAEFMQTLRKTLRIPIGLPAAGWMVKIGAPLFMKTDPELALYGRYCVPARLQNEGFEFDFPEIGPALKDLLG